MKSKKIIPVKALMTVVIFLSMSFNLIAQANAAKVPPAGTRSEEKALNSEQINKQDGTGNTDQGTIQDKKKKKEEENSKQAKEVKSTKPDMNRSKGARPAYINRPSGTIRPQGAGKPGGAIRPGRR